MNRRMEKLIENEEIYLRKFQFGDEESLFELESDPEVYRYIHMPAKTSMDEMMGLIQKVHGQYKDTGVGRLAVIRKSDEELLGLAGLKYETEIRDFPYYDLGYRFKQKHWKKGYGTQSAVLTLKYGFEQLHLEKICAAADAENEGSNKILQRIGMQEKEPFTFEDIPCRWYEMSLKNWKTNY